MFILLSDGAIISDVKPYPEAEAHLICLQWFHAVSSRTTVDRELSYQRIFFKTTDA